MAKVEAKHKEAIDALMLATQYSCAIDQLRRAAKELPEGFSSVVEGTEKLANLFYASLEEQTDKYVER